MATLVTHAYVGCLLAPLAPASARGPRLFAALVLLAVLPDADIAGDLFGIPYAHPLGHRGFTHSLLFAALAGVAGAWCLRPPAGAARSDWLRLTVALGLATASHGILDALTNGGKGVGFFIPLSDARLFLPWRPVQVVPLELDLLHRVGIATILRSEFLWIWLPATAIALVAWLARRGRGT